MGRYRCWIMLGALWHLCWAVPVLARTMYATDVCESVVRSAPRIAGRNIVKVLSSGTPLNVRDLGEVWSTVRLDDGRTGYVETRQMMDRESHQAVAERLQTETVQQRERLTALTQQLNALQEEHQRLRRTSEVSTVQLQNVSEKYEQLREDATTTQFLELKDNHADLQRRHAEVEQQLAALNETYTSLKNSTRLSWFLSGAGVVLAGWILGMSSERWRSRRRRQGGYSYNLPT